MREVCQRVERRRPAGARVAALGDGAAWIWRHYAKYLPNRVEILDFYHAAERLGELAVALHPGDAPVTQQWRRTQEVELLQWVPDGLLRWLRNWQPTTAATQELRRVQLGYFDHQQERIDYPRYLREGWPIGSGAVEGACKHLLTDRFKGTGMRWNLGTAEPLLRVRAALLTNPRLHLRPYAREATPIQAM